MSITRLSHLRPGQRGRISAMSVGGPLRRRLMDMGVLVGEIVAVEKVAPLGDPIEITVKHYKLSLRKGEAEGIEVEAMP